MRLRTLAGTAVVAVALFATGCGSLANNAAGLDRPGDVRQNVVESSEIRARDNNYRSYGRFGRMRRPVAEGFRNARQGVDRTRAQNRYLRQQDLQLRDGRYLGDGLNPPTDPLNSRLDNEANRIELPNTTIAPTTRR
ncbi:MAG: hypothetical protein LBE35_04605 [Clostridiales bacterium]|jgi:hypothetical protein|nr:hypothetical protein [Clostridiales bacterium]